MTTLQAKSIRDSINIDSFERGLVYGAFLLRSAYNDPANDRSIRDYFQIRQTSQNQRQDNGSYLYRGFVTVLATLQYDNQAFLSGGDLLSALLEPVTSSPLYSGANLDNSSNIIAGIIDDDSRVVTLEDYFLFSVMEYQRNLTRPTPSDVNLLNYVSINPSYAGSNDLSTVRLTAVVEYDYDNWLISKNLINAVGFRYVAPINNGTAQMANGVQMSNGHQMLAGVNQN